MPTALLARRMRNARGPCDNGPPGPYDGPVPGRRGIPCQSSPSALASGHQQLAWRASVSLMCVRDRYPGNVLNRCSHVTVRTMSFEQDGLQVIRSRPLFALASLLVWICAKDWRACLVHSPSRPRAVAQQVSVD